MSDDQPLIEATAEQPVEQAVYTCPVNAEILPPQYRKHVDPKAPVPIRGMAAKGLVPLSPSDMITVLFMLMYDADGGVRESAGKTASTLPDRIAASAFRDEQVPPPVLGWFLTVYATNDAYAEMLILNGNTPDDSIAAIAASCTQRIAEIVGQNQLRLLRHEDILRELAKNPVAQGALIDGVCDFAVRNGLVMADVPQMQEARIRLYGPQIVEQPPKPEGPTADDVMQEFGMEAEAEAEAGAPPMEEGKKLTLSQRIMKMNVAEKIKLATKGNKEARGILIRDSNKLVSVAVIRSPRITDGEVLAQSQNKVASDDVLRVIYSNREWLRKYAIKLALVKNPKVPQGVSMRLLNQLHESDVKGLAKDKNVSSNIQTLAKKQLEKKQPKKE